VDADLQPCTRTTEQVAAFPDRARDEDAAEHLRYCARCADTVRRLRAEPAAGPDLELRLPRAFREWRDA
jgi:hypothetical protein